MNIYHKVNKQKFYIFMYTEFIIGFFKSCQYVLRVKITKKSIIVLLRNNVIYKPVIALLLEVTTKICNFFKNKSVFIMMKNIYLICLYELHLTRNEIHKADSRNFYCSIIYIYIYIITIKNINRNKNYDTELYNKFNSLLSYIVI